MDTDQRTSNERDAFEAWAKDHRWDIQRSPYNRDLYRSDCTTYGWWGWRAARATVEPTSAPSKLHEIWCGWRTTSRCNCGAHPATTEPPVPVLEAMRNAVTRVIEQSGGVSHGIDWHALLKSIDVATVPPSLEYKFNVGDRVRWLNTEGESRVTVIDRKVKYQVAWDGRPLDMWVEDHEIEPDSVSTKGAE